MKLASTITIVILLFAGTSHSSSSYVKGYTKKNGGYVHASRRSAADKSYNNNYSTRGNTNPYTGKRGSQAPTYNDKTPKHNKKMYGTAGTIN